MSLDNSEKATTICKTQQDEEEEEARPSDVTTTTTGVAVDRVFVGLTEQEESTEVVVDEKPKGGGAYVAEADAVPDSSSEPVALGSQLGDANSPSQLNQDRAEMISQAEIIPSGATLPGGALTQNQHQDKAASISHQIRTRPSSAATTLPAFVQNSLPRRPSSVPPTSTTRSVPSVTQQADYKSSRLDHADSSSWPKWVDQPQTNAELDDTSDPAKGQPDGNETYFPAYHNQITSNEQIVYGLGFPSIDLDHPFATGPTDFNWSGWSELDLNPDTLGRQTAPTERPTIDLHADSSFDVHQQMENQRTTTPLPTGPGNLPTLPEVPIDDDGLLDGTALGVAIDAARTRLFITLTWSRDAQAPKTATLNLATAQRLVLADVQRRITKKSHEIVTTDKRESATDALKELDVLLDGYCKSLRDLEYMQEHVARHAKNDELDPLHLKSSKHLQRLAMEEAGLVPDHVLPKGLLPIARDQDSPRLPGLSRTVAHRASESEQLWVRFGMASAGGLVLVVPMLIMANLESKTASLVTKCVAMFLFAAGITFGTHLKPDQVLGATAAYAAVLAVFVGTSFST